MLSQLKKTNPFKTYKYTRKSNQSGFSLLEVLIASALLSVAVGGAITLQSSVLRQTTSVNDRTFATEKVMQMFEELRSFVQANRESNITKLQNFSDGASFSHILTTERKDIDTADGTISVELDAPDDPLSGNERRGSGWKYVRQVKIKPVPNDENARFVTVSIWHASAANNSIPDGYSPSDPNPPRPLATISGVLKTNISADPPTQVYDVFLIQMENSPSWWVDLADLRPSFERTLTDLEQRNPGLRYRRHYITRFGYGRDPFYLPYINDANTADAQALPWSILYPGRINHTIQESYVQSAMGGRIRTDQANRFAHVNRNHSEYNVSGMSDPTYRHYALADQFNHTLRWQEQLAMEKRLAHIDPYFARHPSLINFLEDLNTPLDNNGRPRNNGEMRYRNAIVVNLHGELLPVPPIRNYSDPAKAPDRLALKLNPTDNITLASSSSTDLEDLGEIRDFQNDLDDGTANNGNLSNDDEYDGRYISLRNKRVVTHPERMRYNNGQRINWRVYAYEERETGKSRLSNNGDSNYAASVDIEDHSIPITSLFLPTIGTGPHYSGNGNGYLDYPNDSANVINLPTNWNTDTLRITKIVGGHNNRYRTWSSNAPLNNWPALTQLTDTHDPNDVPGTDSIHAARVIGDTGAKPGLVPEAEIGDTQLYMNGSLAAWAAQIAPPSTFGRLRQALRNRLIVIEPGTANEEVVRVADVINNPLLPRIILNKPLKLSHPAGSVVTRHRDFRVEKVRGTISGIDNQLYNHDHGGVRVYLYDTPTRTPTHTVLGSDNTGLPENQRLHGLEYIPTPVSGTNFNQNLADNNTNAKNTARWIVGLNLGQTGDIGTVFRNKVVPLETRIVHKDVDPRELDGNRIEPHETSGTGAPGCEVSNNNVGTVSTDDQPMNELCDGLWGDGDPYIPNNPSTSVNENQTFLRPNLYNVSRTYTYTNHGFTLDPGDAPGANERLVPQVEQAQYLGDARYTPYTDVKEKHRYNRHFMAFNGSNGYANFDRAGNPSWNSVDADMNWYFQLYSHGIMKSNSIYNSISGFSNYYYALGGELGTDGTNATFNIRRQPWQPTSTNDVISNRHDQPGDDGHEIINASRVIMSTDDTTPGGGLGTIWRMKPNLGELFPDEDVQFWRDNGNLPNHSYSSASHNKGTTEPHSDRRFYRERVDEGGVPMQLSYRHRRLAGSGAPSFMNGNSNPTADVNRGLQHHFTGGQGQLTDDPGEAGDSLVKAFNLTLPDSINSNRPFSLYGNSGSGGYTSTEMQDIRNRLAYINSPAGTTHQIPDDFNTYYRHSASASQVASSMIKMSRDGDTSLVGYVLMNGFQNSTGTGTQLMARMAQAGTLQTFMDAGDLSTPGNAPGRTVQLPRVEITEPKAQKAYENPSTLSINFETAWKRWDLLKYSKAYPDDWYETTQLVYNLKYSSDNGVTWKYLDGTAVPSEYIDQFNIAKTLGPAESLNQPSASHTPVSWNVSSLTEGNYTLRVECYRAGFPEMGYAYHDVFITITR